MCVYIVNIIIQHVETPKGVGFLTMVLTIFSRFTFSFFRLIAIRILIDQAKILSTDQAKSMCPFWLHQFINLSISQLYQLYMDTTIKPKPKMYLKNAETGN